MARAKPRWRRVLNARFLRWWLAGAAVRAIPWLGRRLAFFPDAVDMVTSADRVLADETHEVPPASLARHMHFLRLCQPHDSHAPGVVLPDGVVTGRRTVLFDRPWIDAATASVLLPDRKRTVLVRGQRANWNATSVRWRRPRLRVPGRAFAPLNTHNYFHVILENGIRLVDLLESGSVADAPLTVVKPPDRSAVEKAMFDGIAQGYPDVSARHVPPGAVVEPDQAVVHFPRDNYWEWPPIDRHLAGRLAAAFDRVYGERAAANGAAMLYLSRRGAKLRNPVNHAALAAALTDRGVAEFVATDANHPEQMARFRAARVVVAVHGAGLTNLAFCAPGTRVIEIFPSNFVKSPYWWLARRLELRYRPVIAGPGDYDQNFEVDIDAVIAALEED